MIFIIDRFVEGYLHVLANVNSIKILNSIYPNSEKKFIAEFTHTDLVKKYFDSTQSSNLIFEPYKNKQFADVNVLKQIFRVIGRLVDDIVFFYNLFQSIKTDSKALVFITHIYPFSLVFVKFLKKFFPKIKVVLTVHGEVEYLFYGKTKYEKIIGYLYSLVFRLKTSNFYFLFLTKISKEILLNSNKLKEEEVMTIILPTLSDDDIIVSKSKDNLKPLKIGHIGSAGKRKNTQFLYQIAADFKKLILENKINFSVIGPIEDNLKPFLNNNVTDYVNGQTNKHLDRAVFNKESKTIDYSIFFYGENDFVLRSSAAFFDAVYFEKPMIVLKNDFFEDVFNEAGDMGIICKDLDEMKSIIKAIVNNDPIIHQNYTTYLSNIINYKKSLDLSKIGYDLQIQLGKRDLIDLE